MSLEEKDLEFPSDGLRQEISVTLRLYVFIFMFVRKAVALGIPSAMNLSRVNDLCIR